MKRTLSFLLSLIIVIGIITSVPVTVSATDEISDFFTFELNSDGTSYAISGFDKWQAVDVVIPETYNGLPITQIKDSAFSNCLILSVTFSKNLKFIDEGAFQSCKSIKKIVIPDNVDEIGNNAFRGCENLSEIILPEKSLKIGSEAFYLTEYYDNKSNWSGTALYIGKHLIRAYGLDGCFNVADGTITIAAFSLSYNATLSNVIIPDSVERIGDNAFLRCDTLTNVFIPSSVAFISHTAFNNCANLNSFTVDENSNYFASVDGVLFDKSFTVLVRYPCGKNDLMYQVPVGTKTLSSYSFQKCEQLFLVSLPDTVEFIDNYAFSGCSMLLEIDLPDSLQSIGKGAFRYCESLMSVVIPSKVSVVNEYTFAQCYSLHRVVFGQSVNRIESYAFEHSNSLKFLSFRNKEVSFMYDSFDEQYLEKIFYVGTQDEWDSINKPSRLRNVPVVFNANCHVESDWFTEIEPTKYSPGLKVKYCYVCGEVVASEEIPQEKPTTPKLKSVSNVIDGVKVVWNAVEGADGYIVYRKTVKSGWVNIGTSTGIEFVDEDATPGTTYYYTVKAKNGAGTSGYNKTGLAIKYLSAPKLSKVYNNGAGNVLSWGKVTGASGYYVYRKTPSSGWSKIATIKKGTTASYTDKKVTYGKTYIYTVKAYSGKTTSSFNANGITILKKIPNITIATKNVYGGKKVTLSSSISGVAFYYKTSKDGKYKKYTGEFLLTSTKTIYAYAVRSGYYKSSTASKKITVTKVKTPSVVVKNCVGGKKISFTSGTSGATFYYKTSKNGSYVEYTEPFTLTSTKTIYVKAYKPGYATSSTASKKVSVSKIGTPTITSVKAYNDTGKIVLKWKAVSGAQGYYVYRADDTNKSYTRIATVKGGKTVSFTDTSYMPGVKNYYVVRAYCSGKATSSNSKAVSVTAPANNILADPYAFYQKAAQDIHNNGVAGYTRKGWQNIISYEYSNSANENKIKDIIDSYFTPEENAVSYVNEKGSSNCKFWMPATTTTKEYIKSTNVTKVGENYKIEIVLKDQYNPMMDDTDGIVGIAPYTFYIEDVEQAIDDNIELKSIIKQCDKAEALIKNYTITAVMTPDGKFVSISHRSDIDFSAQGKEVDGTDVSCNASFVYAYNCTDFKY